MILIENGTINKLHECTHVIVLTELTMSIWPLGFAHGF